MVGFTNTIANTALAGVKAQTNKKADGTDVAAKSASEAGSNDFVASKAAKLVIAYIVKSRRLSPGRQEELIKDVAYIDGAYPKKAGLYLDKLLRIIKTQEGSFTPTSGRRLTTDDAAKIYVLVRVRLEEMQAEGEKVPAAFKPGTGGILV